MSKQPRERYVVIGMGAHTALGENLDETWQNHVAGRHAISRIDQPDGPILGQFGRLRADIHLGAPINPDPEAITTLSDPAFAERLPGTEEERYGHAQRLMMIAGAEALRQAGLVDDDLRIKSLVGEYRMGCVVGTGLGDGHLLTKTDRQLREAERAEGKNPPKELRVPPYWTLTALPDRVASGPADFFEIHGHTRAVLTACASGLSAVIEGVHALRRDDADFMLVGGTEAALAPYTLAPFSVMRALTKETNPEASPRPGDKNWNGIVMGQGAAAFVITSLDKAIDLGFEPLVEISGMAENRQRGEESITLPSQEGIRLVIKKAVGELPPEGWVISQHETGTSADEVEVKAQRPILPPSATAGITVPKWAFGHTLGAAGAIELAMLAQQVRTGTLVPNSHLNDPIDAYEGYELINDGRAKPADIERGLKIAAGFSGFNAAVAIEKIEL